MVSTDATTSARARPAVPPAAVAETHSAVLFFVGERVYKLKKPVDLGFLDFSTRELRHDVCHREVELNRRLSPDVYLGVADVIGPDGVLEDHLVVMRRLPEDRRLSTMLEHGEPVDNHLRGIARQVAAMHAAAPTSLDDPAIGKVATAAAVAGNWRDNIETLTDIGGRLIADDELRRVDHLANRYLTGRADLFEARISSGQIRDGHGDLLAQDIFCLDDGPRILDCLEFADQYRWGDVLLDVAFLVMDLERRGFEVEAQRLLDLYLQFSGEQHPQSLAHHYIAYRAHVRAKVAAIRWGQGEDGAQQEAESFHRLALEHLRRGRVVLTLVGGTPGAGKSTLAAGLADSHGWALLRSDEVRKELAGVPASADGRAPYGEGMYEPAARADTYRELLRRAGLLLRSGISVVLDASWASAEDRESAGALASDSVSDLVQIQCDVALPVARARIAARIPGVDASDATVEVLEQMVRRFDPWPEATTVQTAAPIDAVLQNASNQVATELQRQESEPIVAAIA